MSACRGAIAVLLAAGAAAPGADDNPAIALGREHYLRSCGQCHGADARGDGPFAAQLTRAPPDLTVLARDAGGEFPFERVYADIDGRTMTAAHGTREMPVWGPVFARGMHEQAQARVHGRILELLLYLKSVQVP